MTTVLTQEFTLEQKICACANRLAVWLAGTTNSSDAILLLLEKEMEKKLPLWLQNDCTVLQKGDFKEIEEVFSLDFPLGNCCFQIHSNNSELLLFIHEGSRPVTLLNERDIENILSLKERVQKAAA